MSVSYQMRNSKQSLKLRAEAELELRKRERERQNVAPMTFREFVTKVNPKYRWYKHCEVLADVLQKVADGKIKRLMVFEPPRHGKSETVSRLFTAYFLYRYPHRWVGLSSYAADLANTLSRNSRDNYKEGGGSIRSDASGVHQWETGKGGGLWATGVGGPATGKGGHLLVVDDPIKNAEDAASETIREKFKDWWHSTWSTREEPWSDDDPHGAVVIVQTRWHEDDPAGWLLEQEKIAEEEDEREHWHIVSLPAIAEEHPQEFPPTCTVEPDWRQPGEALCPERRPLSKLHRIAKRIGEYFWGALFQQRPRPKSGMFFKEEWFQEVGAAPADCQRVRYWDKAGADEGKGDYTVGVLMAKDSNGFFYIEDVVRGQWTAFPRNDVIKSTAAKDQGKYGDVDIWIEQPPGLAKESTDTIVRQLAGYNVHADPVNRDKVERAEPFKAQCEAKNVKLVKGDWRRKYLDELTAFPKGKHDDQVDASSGAFNKLAEAIEIGVLKW